MSEPVGFSEGALAVQMQDLRRVTEVGLEKVAGQLGLVVQRMDQADERANHLNIRIDETFRRVETLERTSVTKDELNARTQRIYVIVGLVVAILGPIMTVVVSIATRSR